MHKYITALVLIFFAFFLEAQNEEEGLVAKYSFDKGNADDEAGVNHSKTYGVSLAADRFGNPGKAYYFHGHADSFINLGTSNALKPAHGTISLWVNSHGIMGLGKGVETNPFIVTRSTSEEDCNQAYYVGFDLNTRRLNGSITVSCLNGASAYSETEIDIAKWNHIVFTYDDTFIKLYVDGKVQAVAPKKFKISFLEGDSVILGSLISTKNIRFFLGCIDDIRIYNRVLSEASIKKLYEAPNPEESKTQLKWIALVLILTGLVCAIIFAVKRRIRSIISQEKAKNELQNNWYEQENRVLTAQMDPHFIFNSLNTIQQFIIINENEKAQLYLSKFSRLMRKILDNNTKNSVSLNDEMEVFEKYLEIESLRFNNVFNYSISVGENINPAKVNIPLFLIQPVIENAIWHGLLPKEGDKHLSISFEKINEGMLMCSVDDNGVGRKIKNKDIEEPRKSLAINFIEQRLQLMSKMKNKDFKIVIEDKKSESGESEGTRVILTIPILNN